MIAAVVVTFSAPAEVLDRCLRSLCDGALDRLVVVDTGGGAVVAADLADRIDLIHMDNLGYGAAANRGFASLAGATAIALLNDDVVVHEGWLPPLVAALDPVDVGAVQPALVGPDPDVVVSLGVELDRYGAGSDVGDGGPLPADRTVRDVDVFTGGAVLFDAAFLDATGGFDERYFLYYEDVDLALRGGSLGWRYRVAPESTVEHRRGTSTAARRDETLFLQERNRLWVAFRFGSVATMTRATWLSVRRLRHEPTSVHRRSLVAGLAAAPRRVYERVRDTRQSSGSDRPATGRNAS
ncbi:glycosyltransferase family 2 protein [Ilumatobacter sp.]|uniref:glycosyltransferase family 2 protein n=1 Tax=Ilumatobacter sp. TaxID=1967498 RepID=UPI003AF8B350